MPPKLHLIDYPGTGRLATMAHPRGRALLPTELSVLRAAGVTVLVSTLTDEEAVRLGLDTEDAQARAAGLGFHALPIPDRGVPADTDQVTVLVDRLGPALTGGGFVAVHCWAGIGRSSLIAGALLIRAGLTVEQACERISAARGIAVPETAEQRAWLDGFARAAGRPRL